MIESAVNDTLRSRRATLQHVQVIQRAAENLGTRGGNTIRTFGGTGEPNDLVTRSDQVLRDSRSDPPASTSYKYTHDHNSTGELDGTTLLW